MHHPPGVGRADLHLHTTFSDGTYTPAQVVDLARRSGLAAIAITDHDTMHGVAHAATVATTVEVVPGVEITSEYLGKEVHLLGYFVDPDDPPLNVALAEVRASRQRRFQQMLDRLSQRGIRMDWCWDREENMAVGRRHLAEMLVRAGHAQSVSQAFRRYLSDQGPIQVAKERIPIARAIQLVREAGGVAAWAHPPYDDAKVHLRDLRTLGMEGLEVYYPSCRPGRMIELRRMALDLDMVVTGGSDCHGPEPLRRAVGSFGINLEDLELLRNRAGTAQRT